MNGLFKKRFFTSELRPGGTKHLDWKHLSYNSSTLRAIVLIFLCIMICLSFVPSQSCAASASTNLEGLNNSNQSGLELDQPASKSPFQTSVLGVLSLKEAATGGDTEAQYALGQAYYDGTGVMQDRKMALEMWRQAAQNGHARAQASLGQLYREGMIIPKDLEEAFKWDMKSAQKGYPPAQFNVGVCYKLGKGVPQDESEAFKWFHTSAQNGDPTAQFVVGQAYSNGEGVAKDVRLAIYWISRAAAQGQQQALAVLTMLTATQTRNTQTLQYTR